MTPRPDIAVVVTTHREGRLMIPTVRGLARTLAHASHAGLSVEVVLVRDRADARTVEQVDELVAGAVLADAVRVQVTDVDHGDLGLARNDGIAASTAPLVGVLDADNLPSENWLAAAHAVLGAATEPSIVHPARILKFGDDLAVWPLMSTRDPRFQPGLLAWFNMWDAFALMHREVALAHPYRECRPHTGFGPEDWAFNCDTVAAGIPHLIAAETTLYYHVRHHGSLSHAHGGSLVPRNALMRDKTLARTEAARLASRLQRAPQGAPAPRSRPLPVRALRRAARLARGVAGRVAHELRANGPSPELREVPAELRALTAHEINDWHGAHLLQPLLRTPVERHLVEYRTVGTDYDDLSVPDRFAYWSAIDQLPAEVDFLAVALWVRTGGGDRMTLEHLHAVQRLRPGATVALITTEPDASEHLAEVPSGVTVVELGQFGLWPQFTEQVLAMVCAQLRPDTIHINNSVAGFWAVERFGRQIAPHSRIYLQTFCIDRYDDQSEWSFLYNRSRDFYDHVTGILTDSQAFVDQVVQVQGVPGELFTVFTVVDTEALAPALAARAERRPSSGPVRLLWAGRFDLQKRLDRVADISDVLHERGEPVEIVIRGRPVIETDEQWREHLARAAAGVAVVEEPFDGGFLNAHPEQFDALLLTSDYEGIAMVVLEAMASGLPVIAPMVGGMSEMIDDEVAFPVDPRSGIDGYLAAIEALRSDPAGARARAVAAHHRVVRRSSRDAFDALLEGLPGYLPRSAGRGEWARSAMRYYALPATASVLAEHGAGVVVYTGSNGHSNFGDILQTKNILASWRERETLPVTLIMPGHAALPGGRAVELEAWYPADAVVFATTRPQDLRTAGLVEVALPRDGRLLHVVGGGYLNARWGGEHFPLIDAVARDAGEAPILFSGLQIDAPALEGFTELARHHRIVQVGLRDHVSFDLASGGLDVPVGFTFDDLTEIFQDWARAAEGHVRAEGPVRVAIHMNTSDYAGGARALAMWRGVLDEVVAAMPGCELVLLHAYDDPRPEVRDTLDTVTALAEDLPFADFSVIDIAKASLEYGFGTGLPSELVGVLDVDVVLSSSYHTALFGAFMGKPAYLMGASDYFRQKAQLFQLPELTEFLADPGAHRLQIPAELEARREWLVSLDALAARLAEG
ncbi:glycosyltransferase [Demequina sp. SO4-13]|uniref:glycosyltransferase n=1 Tax=Demequina sp. SO4-13 TaxID=3401027 RepID=UPI003AF4231A